MTTVTALKIPTPAEVKETLAKCARREDVAVVIAMLTERLNDCTFLTEHYTNDHCVIELLVPNRYITEANLRLLTESITESGWTSCEVKPGQGEVKEYHTLEVRLVA